MIVRDLSIKEVIDIIFDDVLGVDYTITLKIYANKMYNGFQ